MLPGRAKNLTENQHVLERVDEDTDLVFVDDPGKYFDFDFFYTMATGNTIVNEKHVKSKEISFENSPKVIICSNYAPNSLQDSTLRRLLFVTNSDYGNNVKPSLSKIDLKSGAVSEIKDAVITNPMEILTAGDAVYYLDYGTYDENWNQTGAGVRKVTLDGKVNKVVDGTSMCSDGKKIYTVNAPYGGSGINYNIYDTTTGATTSWEPSDIFSPAVIAADPVTGNVFIVSYQKNPDTGYDGYALPSYTNQYDATGKFLKKYENTATGPISLVFNTGVEYK